MVVHVMFPDSIQKPSGGLGEQFGHLYSNLKDKLIICLGLLKV